VPCERQKAQEHERSGIDAGGFESVSFTLRFWQWQPPECSIGASCNARLHARRFRYLRLACVTMPDDAQFTALCAAADVDEAVPVRAEAPGVAVAVFRVGDRYYVTQDACTHGPGSLAEGYVDGEEIECPFHQDASHSVRASSAPPCTIPLRVWDARVIDGQVCIDVRPGGPKASDQRRRQPCFALNRMNC